MISVTMMADDLIFDIGTLNSCWKLAGLFRHKLAPAQGNAPNLRASGDFGVFLLYDRTAKENRLLPFGCNIACTKLFCQWQHGRRCSW